MRKVIEYKTLANGDDNIIGALEAMDKRVGELLSTSDFEPYGAVQFTIRDSGCIVVQTMVIYTSVDDL